jgi:hypothetical protein
MKIITILVIAIAAFGVGIWYADEYGFALPSMSEESSGRDNPNVNVPTEPPPPIQIVYLNTMTDDIQIETPGAGAAVEKRFTVNGKARGNWYFEASMSLELRDVRNELLLQIPVQAQGEWMTMELVPFSTEVSVPGSYAGPATLVIRNGNASGLPEHDKSITIPISIQ